VFGLSGEKLLILAILAGFLLGPERLPEYARKLAGFIKDLRRMANEANAQMKEELGESFEDLDWRKLDPRQYDPRRIIREALADELEPVRPGVIQPVAAERLASGDKAPFDNEAT